RHPEERARETRVQVREDRRRGSRGRPAARRNAGRQAVRQPVANPALRLWQSFAQLPAPGPVGLTGAQPLMTASGTSRATLREIPALWTTSTTSATSLYASGISSAIVS